MVAEQTTSITEEIEIMKKDTKDTQNNLADILTTLIGKIVKIEKALVNQNEKHNEFCVNMIIWLFNASLNLSYINFCFIYDHCFINFL